MANAKPVDREQMSLLVEVMPGTSTKGLMRVFEAGSYNPNATFRDILGEVLKAEYALEDRPLLERVKEEAKDDYIITCKGDGKVLSKPIGTYMQQEETIGNEHYLHLTINVAKAQEGGLEIKCWKA